MSDTEMGSARGSPSPAAATTGRNIAEEVSALYCELRTEIESLAKASGGDPHSPTVFPDPVCLNDVERRLLVRSIFSFVEALTYSVKLLALDSHHADRLTMGERMLAMEETYDISTSGEVAMRRAKLQTLANVRFAFDILAKVEANDFQLDVSQEGWQLLQRSLKVRDRLMHPKALIDLHVSDVEIRDSVRAFGWFENQLLRLVLITLACVRREISQFAGLGTRLESENH